MGWLVATLNVSSLTSAISFPKACYQYHEWSLFWSLIVVGLSYPLANQMWLDLVLVPKMIGFENSDDREKVENYYHLQILICDNYNDLCIKLLINGYMKLYRT